MADYTRPDRNGSGYWGAAVIGKRMGPTLKPCARLKFAAGTQALAAVANIVRRARMNETTKTWLLRYYGATPGRATLLRGRRSAPAIREGCRELGCVPCGRPYPNGPEVSIVAPYGIA